MPIILGLRPGMLALWAEKTGLEKRHPLEGEWIEWGHRLEPILIDVFGERTGWATRPSGQLLRSSVHPWALCTLDAEVNVDGTWFPLEIKTTSTLRTSHWEDGAPQAYRVQVHQQMLVTGAPRAYIGCLIGGQRFVWDVIDRDEQLIRTIISRGNDFWTYVQENTPPPREGQSPAEVKQFLEAMYPMEEEKVVHLPPEFDEVFDRMSRIYEVVRVLEKQKVELQNKVREAMGDASHAHLESGRSFTWKMHTRRGHTVAPSESRVFRMHPNKRKGDPDGRTYH